MSDNVTEIIVKLDGYITKNMEELRKTFPWLVAQTHNQELESVKLATAQRKLETASLQTAVAQKNLESSIAKTTTSSVKLSTASTQAAIAQERLKASTAQAEAAQMRLEALHKKQTVAVSSLSSNFNLLKDTVIAYFSLRTAEHIFKEATAFEAVEYRLKSAIKGYGDYGRTMSWVTDEADRIGMRTRSAAEGFASFAASATRAGLSLETTKKIWTDVAETSVSMRMGAVQTERIFWALNQMASKGVVSMEELRQQLGESLPGALGIAAKSMGMTVQQFSKLVGEGKVLSAEFLPKFASAIRQELGSEFSSAANGVIANAERMKSRFDELYVVINERLFPAFNNLLGWLADTDGAFAKSISFIGKYSQLLGGMSLEMIEYNEAVEENIRLANKSSKTYGEKLLRESSKDVTIKIKETEEALARVRNAPSVITPGGNGTDNRAAQIERLERRLKDLQATSDKVNKSLNNITNPVAYNNTDSASGGSGDEKFETWLEKRIEKVKELKEKERKDLLDSIVKKQEDDDKFNSWLNDKFNENSQKQLEMKKAFEESKIKIYKDAHEREVAELRVQQQYDIDTFKGTEEQKKLILATQLNERFALEQANAEERKALNQKVVQSSIDAAKAIGDIAFETILGKLDMKKEKERAHAITAAQFSMAHALAAAKIWSSAKSWQEGLAESIGVSAGLFAEEIRSHVNINKYELGTNYSKRGRAVVGEREPEVVELPLGSRVTPMSKYSSQGQEPSIHVTLNTHDYSGRLSSTLKREFKNGDGRDVINYIADQVKKVVYV